MTLKLNRGPNPFKIPESQFRRSFQVARDSLERVRIAKILADSQAERVDLMPGDIILRYDGKPITTVDSFFEATETARTEQVKVVIVRDKKELIRNVKKGFMGVWVESAYF